MSFTVEILGFDKVKKLFSDIDVELRPSQTRSILDEIGRVVIQEAKIEDELPGSLRDLFNKDLGVYRDKSSPTAEYVLIGPRFKSYPIHGENQKIAVIAQHMTEGFNQTSRTTKKGYSRGRVKNKVANPVLGAYAATESKRNSAIETGIEKQVKKIKSKNSGLV